MYQKSLEVTLRTMLLNFIVGIIVNAKLLQITFKIAFRRTPTNFPRYASARDLSYIILSYITK